MSVPAYGQYNEQPPHQQFPPAGTTNPAKLPLRGASPAAAIGRFFRKYATFSGRASRSEYWWVMLAITVLNLALTAPTLGPTFAAWNEQLGLIALATEGDAAATAALDSGAYMQPVPAWVYLLNIVQSLVGLALFVPTLALSVRRLHDINLSGWFFLLCLVPLVGLIWPIVYGVMTEKEEGRRFDDVTAEETRYYNQSGGYGQSPQYGQPQNPPQYGQNPQNPPQYGQQQPPYGQ